jgi:flagellin
VPDEDGNVVDPDAADDGLDGLPTVTQLDEALATVRSAMARLGGQDRALESQAEFAQVMVNNLEAGLGIMVDADMAVESARLQALQTRRQLAINALAVANARPKAILTLFQI